jgi:hypothetical protein
MQLRFLYGTLLRQSSSGGAMSSIRNLAIVLCAFFFFLGQASVAVPGPIKVSPTGHYFVDRNGQPFFWLGDTSWPLLVQYSRSQAEAYLSERRGDSPWFRRCCRGHGSGMEDNKPLPNPEEEAVA